MDHKARSDVSASSQNGTSTTGDDAEKGKSAAMPGYMRSTNSTANRRMTPVAPKQRSLSRSNSVTRSSNSLQASSSKLDSSKKTSTPLKKEGQKLNFSNASSIAEAPTNSADVKRPFVSWAAGVKPGMKVSEKVRNRRQSAACLPRGPLRTQQPAHVGDETLSEEIEFEIRRSYLICSLRLLEKAKSARAAVEKRGVHAVWQFHQMISIYRKDIVALREKKRRTEALLPYAKQLKVLRDGLTRVVMLEDDIQSSIKYLVETTRRKLSVLPFAPSTMPHQEAEKVLQQAEAALQSPELEKLPLLIQALESYQHLKEKMDRVLLNSEKCAHLIKEIEDMAIDDEKYRKFVDMMPILQRNGQPSGTSG